MKYYKLLVGIGFLVGSYFSLRWGLKDFAATARGEMAPPRNPDGTITLQYVESMNNHAAIWVGLAIVAFIVSGLGRAWDSRPSRWWSLHNETRLDIGINIGTIA